MSEAHDRLRRAFDTIAPDEVVVVRCRDCKHLRRDDPWWECHRAGFYVGIVDGSEPDGFCAWGERRDA